MSMNSPSGGGRWWSNICQTIPLTFCSNKLPMSKAGSAVAMAMAKRPARPAAAQVEAPAGEAPEAPDPLQLEVDPKLLVSTRGSGPPRLSVHRPSLRRPILQTHARDRFQVLVRQLLVLTLCKAQRAASQPLQMEVVRNRIGKRPRGRGRGGSASQPEEKRRKT